MSRKTITYPDILIVQGTEGEVIQTEGQTVVTHTFRDADVLKTTETETVLAGEAIRDTVILRAQGPQGARGLPEDDVPQAVRIDWISDTVFYKGEASVGQAESNPVWRIRRYTLGADDDVTVEWANGTAAYSHDWTQRASYPYS